MLRNSDALLSCAAVAVIGEFIGLDTSQPFVALKLRVSIRSDGCIVLATAVVIRAILLRLRRQATTASRDMR